MLPYYRDQREWLLISSQIGLHKEYIEVVDEIATNDPRVLTVDKCPGEEKPWNFSRRCHGKKLYNYPEVLRVNN